MSSGLRWIMASGSMEYADDGEYVYARVRRTPAAIAAATPSSTGKTRIVGQGAAKVAVPEGMLTLNVNLYLKTPRV